MDRQPSLERILGLTATLIAIFVFVSGYEFLPNLLNALRSGADNPSTSQTDGTSTATIEITSTSTPAYILSVTPEPKDTLTPEPPIVSPTSSKPNAPVPPTASPIQGNLYRVVNVEQDDVLNIRSGPGISYRIIGTIPPGATDVSRAGNPIKVGSSLWIPIFYQSVEGWVNMNFLTSVQKTIARYLRLACGQDVTVPAGTSIELHYGFWAANGPETLAQNIRNLHIELAIDGHPFRGTQSSAKSTLPKEAICNVDYENSYWIYSTVYLDPLAAGDHRAEISYNFSRPTDDGYGDTYDRPFTQSYTIRAE